MHKNSLTVSTFFQEINIKTMLLGEKDTGKSAFLQKLVSNEFNKVICEHSTDSEPIRS